MLVGGLTVAAIGVLLLSRDQSRVAQFVEAVVAVSGAASSAAGLLSPRLWRQGQDSAAGSIIGLPVAVPVGQLLVVVRGRAQLVGQLRRLLRAPVGGPAILAGPAAKAAYRDTVQARRDVLGDEHPGTLTVRYELAWVIAPAGKHRAALRRYKTVLAAWARILGGNHPDTLTTQNALTSLRNGVIVTPRYIP